MPITLVGDFKVGRELMKADRKRRMSRIRNLERKHDRSVLKGGMGLTASEHKELKQLNGMIPFCSVSTMLPGRIENIVINVKLLQAFMRKLGSRFICTVKVDEHKLTLEYRNRTDRGSKGELELFDLSHRFEAFTDIPKIEIAEDVYHA